MRSSAESEFEKYRVTQDRLYQSDFDKLVKRLKRVNSMIKELMHDPIFLAGKSEIATKEDLQVAQTCLTR